MSSIFKKLFSRKSSKSEALALSGSSSFGGGSNGGGGSASYGGFGSPSNVVNNNSKQSGGFGSILTKKKSNNNNNKPKRLSRKQKRQDKKAAFPSLPGTGKRDSSVPFSSANNNANGTYNHGNGGDLFAEEKENSPVGGGSQGHTTTMGMRGGGGYVDHHQTMSYTKPTLSLIAEEVSSPRNDENSNVYNGSDGNGMNGSFSSGVGGMAKSGNNGVGGHQLLSPMSGNKPPLTPNRMGRSSNTTSNNINSGHRHHNDPSSSPISPDASLRGIHHANSPSNTSASSNDIMCLSSDADDEEYNRIAFKGGTGAANTNGIGKGGVAAAGNNNNSGATTVTNKEGSKEEKYVSALDRSPFSYGSDDDNALFPALVDDKDPFAQDPMMRIGNPRLKNGNAIVGMTHETHDDIRAWTPSPTKKGSSSFTFTQGDKLLSPSAVSSSRVEQRRSAGSNNSGGGGNNSNSNVLSFENFADFEPFDPNQKQFGNNINNNSSSNKLSSSKSVAHNPSPVSALLEDSRARRKSSRNVSGDKVFSSSNSFHRSNGVGGSSSINSAPVVTTSYVRSQVRSSRQNSSSISRVIDNLELHVNKRQGKTTAGSSINSNNVNSIKDFVSEASSQHSRKSAESAIREAKERIKRENLMNNESKMIDILASGGGGAHAAAVMNAKNGDNNWLFDEVTGTLGPRSVAADLESLGGRSNRSGKSRNSMGNKSHRSHRSRKSSSQGHRRHRSRDIGGDVSVDSRTSRNSRASYRSYQTTKSMVSQMSEQSRSVANDLLRLEAQLSMVGKSRQGGASVSGNSVELNKRRDDCGMTVTSRDFSLSRSSAGGLPRPNGSSKHISASARRAAARTLRSKVSVVAPPGKLGIILANRTDSRGTVVSGVRTSSVLAEQVSPGDRIIAIDEEDVSQMNVKEITTIMARKSEFERVLVLLTAPKQQYD